MLKKILKIVVSCCHNILCPVSPWNIQSKLSKNVQETVFWKREKNHFTLLKVCVPFNQLMVFKVCNKTLSSRNLSLWMLLIRYSQTQQRFFNKFHKLSSAQHCFALTVWMILLPWKTTFNESIFEFQPKGGGNTYEVLFKRNNWEVVEMF